MSLIAAPIFIDGTDSVSHALERAKQAASAGARIIEWRVDQLAHEPGGAAATRRLIRESPAPCIVTCRSAEEGGAYEGDETARLDLYQAIIDSDEHPRYLDMEFNAVSREPRWHDLLARLAKRNAGTDSPIGLILSSHDFERRPTDLIQRIEAMHREPAASVVKIAWRARSLRDNLEAFDLLSHRSLPMIALCMGPFGMMSRVLAPKFGGLLTFAADAEGGETAPGQPTIDALRLLYRFDSISAQTKTYGVIGWPVEHSLSPVIHNAGFRAVEHDGVYLPLPIPPEYEHFKATVSSLVDHSLLDFRGASVTLPHKENLIRFVRERSGTVDPLAERIGAANTLIVREDGSLECSNTDCAAAMEPLIAAVNERGEEMNRKTLAILGAGGVARAVAVGASRLGADISIFNRTRERAESLARNIGASLRAGTLHELASKRFDIIINCTSVGMTGGFNPEDVPLNLQAESIDSTTIVFETIYSPEETPLVKLARSRGAKVITGKRMFLRQAAMQFKLWTGIEAPMNVFERVVEPATAGNG
ncbi:MAG TPA: shikimate dehydrogenase [Phycisphaerales bacterium]|nr:shikimate dehydrogenase [Phycisphaerales bacterium]HRQ76707.1 shikimate dehydrogenase [Phycisphaerales bacterium]